MGRTPAIPQRPPQSCLEPYYSDNAVTLYRGDCRQILPALAEARIALVITDPPYAWSDGQEDSREWFDVLQDGQLAATLSQLNDLLIEGGALYAFVDVRTGIRLFPALRPANVLVWDKGRVGRGSTWGRMHEWIAYCPRPGHHLRNGGLGDILRAGPPRPRQHPTEKPVSVLSTLIENSSDPGDLILDPFAGSGSTLVAARHLGRRAIGIEISDRYCAIAAERLAQGRAEGPRVSVDGQQWPPLRTPLEARGGMSGVTTSTPTRPRACELRNSQ